MYCNRDRVDFRLVILLGKSIGKRSRAEDKGRDRQSCNIGREQQIQCGVCECGEGAKIEREIQARQKRRLANRESWCIRALDSMLGLYSAAPERVGSARTYKEKAGG